MTRDATPRLTKVIATIGPACDSPETLEGLLRAGMNVARLNLSHGSHAEHAERVARLRRVAGRLGASLALMLDTRGPEVRTGPLAGDPVPLAPGDGFVLHVDGRPASSDGASVSHLALPREVEPGSIVLVDDGRLELRVTAVRGDAVHCEVLRGGALGSRRSLHVPGRPLSLPSWSEAHEAELRFAADHDLDYVALSFVRGAEELKRARDFLARQGAEISLIAKIEDRSGVEHLDDIVEVADGAMVARGDLGVALPVGEVPLVQKRIIRTTVAAGKPVITATQMLDSMERSERPTRAEASDVANAIFDGSSALMLSGETAQGLHPVLAVRTLVALARQAERGLAEYGDLQRGLAGPPAGVSEAVAQAAVGLAHQVGAAAILTLTETGSTSRSISKYRPRCPILAVTPSARVVRRLALNWGVTPLAWEGPSAGGDADEERVAFGLRSGVALGCLRPGDRVVVTAGISRAVGSTNRIRVVAA